MNRVIYVSLPYATFGIEVDDNLVVAAAPIAKWMIGKRFVPYIDKWIDKKNGFWKPLTSTV